MPTLRRGPRILLVEDNEDDVFITRRSFQKTDPNAEISHVSNGVECLKYLRQEAPYETSPLPDLVLLDINMPLMDGREVLEELSADPKLRQIPVVVLTTSESNSEVREMYRLKCNTYITKPVDFNDFHAAVQQIYDYWFHLAANPNP
jgi:CheY-like chemotaxis protein